MDDIFNVLFSLFQGIIDTETRAVCTGQYSDISPLSGGDVAFGTLENRYGSYDFHSNKAIQVGTEAITSDMLVVDGETRVQITYLVAHL